MAGLTFAVNFTCSPICTVLLSGCKLTVRLIGVAVGVGVETFGRVVKSRGSIRGLSVWALTGERISRNRGAAITMTRRDQQPLVTSGVLVTGKEQ
jgi:hypothetical protein